MWPIKLLVDALREIYHGDSESPSGDGTDGAAPSGIGRLHAAEEGMVSLVTVVAVLFFLVLFGLIVNAARVANRKVEVQNSADAVAYSSSLCMARGMNAVTAANHVMGELTAIAVLVDALAGAEYRRGSKQICPESQALNDAIIAAWSAVGTIDFIVDPFIHNLGQNLVDTINRDTPGGLHDAGATLYDARLTLKYWTWFAIVVEGLGDIASVVPIVGEVLGPGLILVAGIAYVKIQQEWEFLNALQTIADVLSPLRDMAGQMIHSVHLYAQLAVNLMPLAVAATVKSVSEANQVTGALYPTELEVRLPVIPEPPPRKGQNTYSPSQQLPAVAQDLKNAVDAGARLLSAGISLVGDAVGALSSILPGGKKANPLQKLQDFAKKVNKFSAPPGPTGQGFPTDNPSQKPFADLKIDDASERKSQWVRAAYPWVNAWRTPVKGAMDELLTFSMASLWYTNWTNKYTLARSHRYRTESGFFLYVMQDSKPGSKGDEPWTRREGSRLAERRFMVMGFAQRAAPKPTSPAIYKQPNPDGFVAYAQAMIYNANEQAPGSASSYQPQIGWDTLNWKYPVDQSGAYEFEQGNQSGSSGDWAHVLNFLHPSAGQNPVIHLNWQAKLVPVTRLGEARNAVLMPAPIRKVLRRTPELSEIINH